jgi:hypothetical protein
MSRADLHSALVLDHEIYRASRVEPDLMDPVVRTAGGIPGNARPIIVLRDYQGPQGSYTEHFVLTDRDGSEVARSPLQRIRLSGEAFEDGFTTVLDDVYLRTGTEHTATFFVDDVEVGSIPVFVESGTGGDPAVAAEETFTKAVQKGAVVWLTVPQPAPRSRSQKARKVAHHTQPVWFVFEGGKLYVLNGQTEQQVPNLGNVTEVSITARSKDLRSKVSEVRATVRTIPTEDERWEKVARTGLGKRLNLPDGDAALERWRTNCTLFELTPQFRDAEKAASVPAAAAQGGAAAATADAGPAAATDSGGADEQPRKSEPAEDDIHVEVEVDQAVYDQLIAEGKSERIARAKAKAAFVRAEKARIRAEREGAA